MKELVQFSLPFLHFSFLLLLSPILILGMLQSNLFTIVLVVISEV